MGRGHARTVRAARRQVVLLRRRTSRRFSPTASSAASRSSPATRSAAQDARERARAPPSSTTRTSAAGASPCSASSERCLGALPARSACARSTTATRRWSRRRGSRSRAAPIRKVRQSVHRLEKAGYSTRVLRPSERRRGSARRSSRRSRVEWRGDAPERGFVMALDALFRAGDDDAVFVIGFDPEGRAAGASSTSASAHAGSRALALVDAAAARACRTASPSGSSARRSRGRARTAVARVSLNFSPFAALLAPDAELTRRAAAAGGNAAAAEGAVPARQPAASSTASSSRRGSARFVVYERRRDLPRVGCRRARRRGVPSVSVIALGLALAVVSAVAINGGYALQHCVRVERCRRSRCAGRCRSLLSLFRSGRWSLGFFGGIAGWVVVRRRRSGSRRSRSSRPRPRAGIGVLALGGGRLRRAERVGVGAALDRPAACSRSRSDAHSVTLARRVVPGGDLDGRVARGGGGARALLSRPAAGLGTAAGVLYAAGDVGTKAARRRRRAAAVRPGAARLPRARLRRACSSRSSAAAGSRPPVSPCSGRTRCRSSPARRSSPRRCRAAGSAPLRVAAFALVLVGAVALSRRGAAPGEPAPVAGPRLQYY